MRRRRVRNGGTPGAPCGGRKQHRYHGLVAADALRRRLARDADAGDQREGGRTRAARRVGILVET